MATPVPYRGTPEIEARQEGVPGIGINTPPAAFGVDVAQSIEHLGQVNEGAGKEIFERAIAMQTLDQQAAANAGIADYQNKAMQHYLDFSQLEGKNAVDSYNGFLSNLDQTRDDIRKTMPSPYAQQLFDQESRNSRFRLAFSGGVYAKDQQKRYLVGSAQSAIKSDQSLMELDPDDTAGNRKKLDDIRAHVNHLADIGGVSPEQRTQMVNEEVSKSVYGQVLGLAKKDPIGAKKLLDQQIADKTISGEDADKAYSFVRQQNMTIGTRQQASYLRSGQDIRFGDKVVDAPLAQTGIKAIESSGGNYHARGPTVTDKAGNTGQGLGAYQVMSYNLPAWLREAGMSQMTTQDFLNNSTAQDKLFQFKFGQYMQKYGSFNRAAAAWFTGSPDAPMSASDGGHSLGEYLSVANRAMFRGAPLAQQVAAGRDLASAVWGDDPEFQDRMEQQVETLHNNDVRIRNETVFSNEQTLWGQIVNGVGPNNQIPTTVDELTADPKAKEAWDWMAQNEPSRLKGVMAELAKNARGDVAMTQPRLNEWQRLSGEAVHDPEKFLEETRDLSKVDLPLSYKKQIIGMQAQIERKQQALPDTAKALSVIRDQITNVFGSPINDKESYNQFTGILTDALSDFQKDNGRPANLEEIKTIGAQLLQSVSTGGFFGFGGSRSWYDIPDSDPIYHEWLEKAKTLPEASTFTDQMLKRIFVTQQLESQYQNLYGKKGGTNARPNQ